jgi:hypothetical protein
VGRTLGVAWQRAAGVAFLLSILAPACAGRSIRDEEEPAGDDLGYGGSTGTGGFSGTAGTATTGGRFPAGGTPGTGGAPATGGAFPTGGTQATGGGISVGGTSPCDADRPGDPIAGSGSAGPPNTHPECLGIKSNAACLPEGKSCPNLVCGLADTGRRSCNCATVWTCSACDYTNSPFRDAPCDLPACSPEVADVVPCAELHTVCSAVGGEVCACYLDPVDGLIWDCDRPPSSWGVGCVCR